MVSAVAAGTMPVQQAVFASTDRGTIKGYHLVAQSGGIDTATALELTRWAPTQLPSDAPENWTISSWTLQNGSIAVARTVYGGPEYSNRGGTQVVTLFLILTETQFYAYDYDAVSVVSTALTLGYLRLPSDMRHDTLSPVQLPDRPIIDPKSSIRKQRCSDQVESLLSDVTTVVACAGRVAVIGFADPVDALRRMIAKMTPEQRRTFSFTTGLSPSIRRPLQTHFYARPDVARQRALESQEIVSYNANRNVST